MNSPIDHEKLCKQVAFDMAVDLYHRAGMGPRFAGPGAALAEFDEIIKLAERYIDRAESKIIGKTEAEEKLNESKKT
jgi:hypothetical protein